MINPNVTAYVEKITNYIKSKYANKICKVVIFGDSVNPDVENPESLDVALKCIDEADNYNYEMLGDILSFMGDTVEDRDSTVVPICDNVKREYLNLIDEGVVVYGKT